MNCPMQGCDNPVEPGPNCYIGVDTGDQSVKKLVCQDCAELYLGHLT